MSASLATRSSATISLSRRGRVFHLNQFQFDRFFVASLQVYRDTLFFRVFQEIRIFPLALFHTVPAEQIVFSRRQPTQVKVPVLIRRNGLEQVMLLSLCFFRHGHHPNTSHGQTLIVRHGSFYASPEGTHCNLQGTS